MTDRRKTLARFFADESGATAIEYGLILGLMVIAIVAALTSTGEAAGSVFNAAADAYPT